MKEGGSTSLDAGGGDVDLLATPWRLRPVTLQPPPTTGARSEAGCQPWLDDVQKSTEPSRPWTPPFTPRAWWRREATRGSASR